MRKIILAAALASLAFSASAQNSPITSAPALPGLPDGRRSSIRIARSTGSPCPASAARARAGGIDAAPTPTDRIAAITTSRVRAGQSQRRVTEWRYP